MKNLPSPTYGRIESVLLRLTALPTVVQEVQPLSDRFRLITLQGDGLRRVHWSPGEKVELKLGSFVSRTYTPLNWNYASGNIQLLVYLHGDAPHRSPGAGWAQSANVGDKCMLFGPRNALSLHARKHNTVFFGDETSFATAGAFVAANEQHRVSYVFEVNNAQDARGVLDVLQLRNAVLVQRNADNSHLAEVEAQIGRLAQATQAQDFIFSGNANSIQRLRHALKQRRMLSTHMTKAYWAVGKLGLD